MILVVCFSWFDKNPSFGHDSVYTLIKIALQALLKVECKRCIIMVGLKVL